MRDRRDNTDQVNVFDSIRDLTRIYKPTDSQACGFVSSFVRKYKIPKGNDSELLRVVRAEIAKMNAERTE
jgi:hypothetical protein